MLALALLIAAAWSPASAAAPSAARGTSSRVQDSAAEIDLAEILERLARVAELYRDHALEFTCDEELTSVSYDRSRRRGRVRKLEFIYIYTFGPSYDVPEPTDPAQPTSPGKLADYRTNRGRDQEATEVEEVDLATLGLPAFMSRAYSWIFSFQESVQPHHEYEIVEKARVFGRDAVAISFRPVPPIVPGFNDWFGTAWVDLESYQLLRVEGMSPQDHAENEALERARKGEGLDGRTHLVVRTTTEFRVEKNGMRFPTRVKIEGTSFLSAPRLFAGRRLREYPSFEVEQKYENYRFFSVRSEAEIRSLVRGGRIQKKPR